MILIKALQRQAQALRNNPLTSFLLITTIGAVLYLGYVHQEITKPLVYLAAMWVCMFAIDLLTINKSPDEFVVKRPRRESFAAILFTCVGILGMMLRFVWLDWENSPGLLKIAIIPMVFLCAFPVAIAILLLVWRYQPRDLGFRISKVILVGLPVLYITALAALVFAKSGLTYGLLIKEEGGLIGVLVSGFLVAALPEEFMRLVIQTRLGAFLKNRALGWYIACFLWAFMHSPTWYGQSKDIFESLMGAVRIIPLGLMWSYLIHRTKNIFPSIIAHGLNVWGLQNF